MDQFSIDNAPSDISENLYNHSSGHPFPLLYQCLYLYETGRHALAHRLFYRGVRRPPAPVLQARQPERRQYGPGWGHCRRSHGRRGGVRPSRPVSAAIPKPVVELGCFYTDDFSDGVNVFTVGVNLYMPQR